MKVVRTSDTPKKPHQTPLFTSPDVTVQRLLPEGAEYNVNIVNFGKGIRNKFHTHESTQVLIVTEGKGIVATQNDTLTDNRDAARQGALAAMPPSRKRGFWQRCRIYFRRVRMLVWMTVLLLIGIWLYLNQVGLPGFAKRPLLEQLVDSGQTDLNCVVAFSYCLERTGEEDRALRVLRSVLAALPVVDSAVRLVSALVRLGRHEDLARELPELVARFPGNAVLLAAQSEHALASGDYATGSDLMHHRWSVSLEPLMLLPMIRNSSMSTCARRAALPFRISSARRKPLAG